MPEFKSMTVVAAAEIIERMSSQAAFTTLVLSWGVEEFCGAGSVMSRANDLARFAIGSTREVPTIHGQCNLSRAMVDHAVTAPKNIICNNAVEWSRFVAGLRMDGFEIVDEKVPNANGALSLFDDGPAMTSVSKLRRMLPNSAPSMNFREAESEIERLLVDHGFTTAKGHLDQALSAFQRGQWSSANGELRKFLEEILDKIAEILGADKDWKGHNKREFLSQDKSGPFFRANYNEWQDDNNKRGFAPGLLARLHPEGGHPGLSEEDDATFRMQTVLITARLFLRRFDQRK